jgi:hypothetical protein
MLVHLVVWSVLCPVTHRLDTEQDLLQFGEALSVRGRERLSRVLVAVGGCMGDLPHLTLLYEQHVHYVFAFFNHASNVPTRHSRESARVDSVSSMSRVGGAFGQPHLTIATRR